MSKGMELNSVKNRMQPRQPGSRINERIDSDLNESQPHEHCPKPPGTDIDPDPGTEF